MESSKKSSYQLNFFVENGRFPHLHTCKMCGFAIKPKLDKQEMFAVENTVYMEYLLVSTSTSVVYLYITNTVISEEIKKTLFRLHNVRWSILFSSLWFVCYTEEITNKEKKERAMLGILYLCHHVFVNTEERTRSLLRNCYIREKSLCK